MDEHIVETAENTQQEEKKKGTTFSDFMEIVESVIISVFAVLLIFTFVCRPVTVDGTSMVPTLQDKDKLIMRMMGYTPKCGDIVIVENDSSHRYENGTDGKIIDGSGMEKRLIKRVIAVGGQTVDIDFEAHTVTVDGEQLYESYIYEPTELDPGMFEYPVTVPEGYVFVMGDNRNNSSDSRDPVVGNIHRDEIIGKAWVRICPLGKFGLIKHQ